MGLTGESFYITISHKFSHYSINNIACPDGIELCPTEVQMLTKIIMYSLTMLGELPLRQKVQRR